MREPASRKDFDRGRSLVSTDDLPCEIDVRLRGVRLLVVFSDRDARGGRLTDLHRLANYGIEDLMVTEILERLEHVAAKDRAAVVEGREQAEHLELGIEPALHGLDDPQQRRHPL